jgi:hypothetical protein
VRVEEACEPAFARHETFHPRYGWLKKAYEGALADPVVFTSENATVQLGVGKNMVRAIRFWGRAARILSDQSEPGVRRGSRSVPSRIGRALLADDGWDPYCEDPASLWLLHWWFLAPPSILPVWWAAFHDFTAIEFTEEQLTEFAIDHIRATPGWQPPHPSSIAKDVSCLLRTYCNAPAAGPRTGIDDIWDCPFRDLGLLRSVPGRPRTFRFVLGSKPTLPPEIVLFAALDFVVRTEAQAPRTITVSRLASEPGGPGRAFRLPEAAFVKALEAAILRAPDAKIASPAGVVQLQFETDPVQLATKVLLDYFASRRRGIRDKHPVAVPMADLPVDASESRQVVRK